MVQRYTHGSSEQKGTYDSSKKTKRMNVEHNVNDYMLYYAFE